MATLAKHIAVVACNTYVSVGQGPKEEQQIKKQQQLQVKANQSGSFRRREWIVWTLAATAACGLRAGVTAVEAAELDKQKLAWGTHSFIKERYFQEGLSPEEAVARIKHTAEGLRALRPMLDTMSWRYIIYYIRIKAAYLASDLNNALLTLPESRHPSYTTTANQLVSDMAELDYYVRTPKIYESNLYYDKMLKSLDDLVAQLA